MRNHVLCYAAALSLACVPLCAKADTYSFNFGGPGVSGTIALTYGAATDAKYSQAYEVTGISGKFSDANIGIINANITGLESLSRATPEPTNLLAPNDFSKFAVAAGLAHGGLNYDNLFYPGGSPQTATDYMFHGGFLDIYGLLFDLGNGDVVNLWSNGVLPMTTAVDYGAAVVTKAQSLDYVGNGVAVSPEPGSLWLLGTGVAGTLVRWRSRKK